MKKATVKNAITTQSKEITRITWIPCSKVISPEFLENIVGQTCLVSFGGADNMLKGNQNCFCVKVIPI